MFLGKDRFFYQGLSGDGMKPRTLGAFGIYLAPTTHFQIRFGSGEWMKRTVIAVPANASHQIMSDCGTIISFGIEPERITAECLRDIQTKVNAVSTRSDPLVENLIASRDFFSCPDRSGDLSASDFDRLIFGQALCTKRIDPRIETVLAMFENDMTDTGLAARDCAEAIQLSTSRFLHLFKDSTGASFRSFRMWKRARQFLAYANLSSSLTTVALDLGYPDSSHFSHSIRKTYGLKPRSIRDGSRHLKVYAGRDFNSANQMLTA
ncbi:helix-turn-helix domain-containing protein [Thalassovita taeanensis]|nr:helix-turn-helix domain-containing protein [Thalassovita taeanensis]